MIDAPLSFAASTELTELEPGRYTLEVSERWLQGPGAYGGITAAWLLGAMTRVVAQPERRPRELGGTFCARIKPGPAEVRARVARAGMNVSFLTAELYQRDRVAATGSAVFARTRPDAFSYDELTPLAGLPAPEACPLWTLPGGLPTYASNFEIRPCHGPTPLDGQRGPETAVWIRPRAPEELSYPLAAALLDAFAPGFFTRVNERRPAGTVSWSVHFLAELPRVESREDDYHLLRVKAPITTAGFSSEDDELWTRDGQLLARARQLVAAL